jgi:HK97 family phage prohead protease
MNLETKTYLNYHIIEHKQIERNGVPVGIIQGYIATWDLDRGGDRFVKGCFSDSLQEHREKGRQIRLKGFHMKVIGGFPIDKVVQDDRGLFAEGEINLVMQEGLETFSLIKQGVLTDLSIGYSAIKPEFRDNERIIHTAKIWEGSVVDEPMNENANITEVKRVNSRAMLPKSFADRARMWDQSAAEKRVRAWAGADDGPTEKYRNTFLFYDEENEENFTAYKLQIADVIDDSIKIIPRAVFAVRAVLAGARGGVNIPSADKEKIKNVVNTLYREMDLEAPFSSEGEKSFCVSELKGLPKTLLSRIVRNKNLSKEAAEYVAGLILSNERENEKSGEVDFPDMCDVANIFKNIKEVIKNG